MYCYYTTLDKSFFHRADQTVELLQSETVMFIPVDLRLPYCLHFNPVDYQIWGIMQDCLY